MAPCSWSLSTTWATVDCFWPMATYTQKTPLPFWLMIVSIATAVLPVWRSPMMSSRWPRPIGIMRVDGLEARLQRLVDGLARMMPGALISTRRRCLLSIGPLPSIGWPSALTTRPTRAGPTGTSMMRPVRLTSVALLDRAGLAEDGARRRCPLEVEHEAVELTLRELDELAGHRAATAVHARDAVTDRQHRARLGDLDGLVVCSGSAS
jgi:hypothetical protein